MIAKIENLGKRQYMAAMARGGGNNQRQAIEVLKLGNLEFYLSLLFAYRTMNSSLRLESFAHSVNSVHQKIMRVRPLLSAPTNLQALDILKDMTRTFEFACVDAS